MPSFQKRKKQEIKGEDGNWSFKFHCRFSQRETGLQRWGRCSNGGYAPRCLHLWAEHGAPTFRGPGPWSPPGPPPSVCTAVCQGAAAVLGADSDRINHNSLHMPPPQAFKRFPSSRTVAPDRLPVHTLCRWGERSLVPHRTTLPEPSGTQHFPKTILTHIHNCVLRDIFRIYSFTENIKCSARGEHILSLKHHRAEAITFYHS